MLPALDQQPSTKHGCRFCSSSNQCSTLIMNGTVEPHKRSNITDVAYKSIYAAVPMLHPWDRFPNSAMLVYNRTIPPRYHTPANATLRRFRLYSLHQPIHAFIHACPGNCRTRHNAPVPILQLAQPQRLGYLSRSLCAWLILLVRKY